MRWWDLRDHEESRRVSGCGGTAVGNFDIRNPEVEDAGATDASEARTAAPPERSEPTGAGCHKGVEAMLCLCRKRNEKLMIGDDITVTVLEIRGDKVRLGIEAPADIPVHRREVYDAIQRNHGSNVAAQAKAVAIDAIRALAREVTER